MKSLTLKLTPKDQERIATILEAQAEFAEPDFIDPVFWVLERVCESLGRPLAYRVCYYSGSESELVQAELIGEPHSFHTQSAAGAFAATLERTKGLLGGNHFTTVDRT